MRTGRGTLIALGGLGATGYSVTRRDATGASVQLTANPIGATAPRSQWPSIAP